MLDLFDLSPTIAVFPVLVGPLQTLLALLPAILAGAASMVFAIFKPGGFVKFVKLCWRQKPVLGTAAVLIWAWQHGYLTVSLHGKGAVPAATNDNHLTNWDSARGGERRLGRGPGDRDATIRDVVWKNQHDKTVLSSPAIAGDRVIFSTATEIGPFTPEGRGAIVCVDAHSGKEVWRYAPENYRATFSSAIVSSGVVICGEGLHQVDDARVTCLDAATGKVRWEFRTHSHVESTPAIADGRVVFGAGDDGFYCLDLAPDTNGKPKVLWHLPADQFADCESSPVVSDKVVYFGLGEAGCALCAVQIETGELLWKISAPYPVFAPPTLADGKLLFATGNGNFVQSAVDLLEMKLQLLRDDGATEQQLTEARERWKPVGEIWCVDLATRNVDWKFATTDAILGAIACSPAGFYFGSRDGSVYRLSASGERLASYAFHEPLISSVAVGQKHIYCTTASGRLFCLQQDSLKPVWDASLGTGQTFSSSPTLAHGHVYVGTAEQGLLCIGRPGDPTPSIWSQGETGGSADDAPVPDALEIVWQFPEENEARMDVTAPLMPLDGAVYVAGVRENQPEFLRLEVRAANDAARKVWSRSFSGRIHVAPVGCGSRICVIEDAVDSNVLQLHCLSAETGDIVWTRLIAGPNPMRRLSDSSGPTAGMSIDFAHLYVWTKAVLGCFELNSGALAWEQSTADDSSPSHADASRIHRGYRGVGAGISTEGIVLAVAIGESTDQPETIVIALDGVTGTVLWRNRIQERITASPMAHGLDFTLPFADKFNVYSIVDGSFVRNLTNDQRPIIDWKPSNDVGRAVVPAVSQNGRVYVATDKGRVFCLGASQP